MIDCVSCGGMLLAERGSPALWRCEKCGSPVTTLGTLFGKPVIVNDRLEEEVAIDALIRESGGVPPK